MNIRVLLADDQPLVRAGLAMLLERESDITVVGEAGDGYEAIQLARKLDPDVVVMDVRMPRLDGVETTRRMTTTEFADRADRPLQIIVLTTYNIDEAVDNAIRAGASGFVLKDAAPDELPAAIRSVKKGDAWIDPKVSRRLLQEFARRPDNNLPTPEGLSRLTPREREVLRLVAFGWSNSQIADHLVVGMATVKTHVARTLMKLDLRDRAAAVAAAYQTGLVKPGERPPAK